MTWHALTVPAQANGHAALTVTGPSGQTYTLAEYDIPKSNHVFIEPSFGQAISNADFVGVGSLVGLDAPQSVIAGNPFDVRLVWKASATASTAYTVFVHLLDSSGQVIAQNDSQPDGGNRSTMGWLPGEYISDLHHLTFNRNDYSGPATLEVGLYDSRTGQRVLLVNGIDHLGVPRAIFVQKS